MLIRACLRVLHTDSDADRITNHCDGLMRFNAVLAWTQNSSTFHCFKNTANPLLPANQNLTNHTEPPRGHRGGKRGLLRDVAKSHEVSRYHRRSHKVVFRTMYIRVSQANGNENKQTQTWRVLFFFFFSPIIFFSRHP